MANIRLPLNILALIGKSPADPSRSFNRLVAYQIRDSLNGLPEFAMISSEANPALSSPDIIVQIREFSRQLQQSGIAAFLILFPRLCLLNEVDKRTLQLIYQQFGDSLLHQTYFIICGPAITDAKAYRQFTTQIIHFLADIRVIKGQDRWTFVKYRFVYVGDLEEKQLMQLAMNRLKTYGCLGTKEIGMGAAKFQSMPNEAQLVAMPNEVQLVAMPNNENYEILEFCQRVSSLPALLRYENYLKYFAAKNEGISIFLNKLYEQIFRDPNYRPIRSVSADFFELLQEIKQIVRRKPERKKLMAIEEKHNERLWTSAGLQSITIPELGHSYFISIQSYRLREYLKVFHLGFSAVPTAECEGNVLLYQSKPEMLNIGNCIEIGDPTEATGNENAEQWMEQLGPYSQTFLRLLEF